MANTRPDLAAVVELARHAPSVHNTQPWQFRDDRGVLTVRRDETRRLPVLDPEARQQTISCGAALHLASLGLRLQGFEPVLELARPAEAPTLARLRALPGHPAAAEDAALERAARSRHMQRARFEDREVDPEVVEAMRAAVQGAGAWVRFLKGASEQLAVAVLLNHADHQEVSDESYREELEAWTSRPASARDGLVPEATDLGDTPRASDVRLRDFAVGERPGRAPARGDGPDGSDDAPPPVEHPLVAIIGTTGDGPSDWLVAGQALCALLLQAEIGGVQASPLGQVLDRPWTRRRLAGELGLVGHPQMVLRLGHAEPGPATPRRPVRDVLT
jgi:hypothetical protein